jgi:cob(I)alamin adenosyltransferase
LARIYTRTGDDGTTGLIGGKRVPKDSLRIEACGSLDELNALIGVVRSQALPEPVDGILQFVQEYLFIIGAELATPDEGGRKSAGIGEDLVRSLESEIDRIEEKLPPLQQFILPGGSRAGAELHRVRTVARRAERHCVSLARLETIDPKILHYLNRLSDLCFVLARYVNMQQSVPEQRFNFGNSSRQ